MKQSDLHKFRLILTDGEDTFQLAVFNDSKTGTALNEKFSIITIADSQSRVFKYENRFTLLQPEVENTKVRKALMYHHKDQLPRFLFDGTMLFSTTRLNQDDQPIVLQSPRNDGVTVTITVKLVGEVTPTDYHYIQFFNIVLRQAMEKMGLTLLRRDYYDQQSAVQFSAHKLEVWPGYVTTIRQHESKILLCCEIGNKVLRTDTVLEQIEDIARRLGSTSPAFRSSVEKALSEKNDQMSIVIELMKITKYTIHFSGGFFIVHVQKLILQIPKKKDWMIFSDKIVE